MYALYGFSDLMISTDGASFRVNENLNGVKIVGSHDARTAVVVQISCFKPIDVDK